MKNGLRTLTLALMLTCLSGSPVVAASSGEAPLKATVSILPQKYFVERIGGDRVAVSVMVMPGANPATYEPKPRQMVDLTQSGLYFAIGVPFETVWLDRFAHANPGMEIVSTQDRIEKIPMASAHVHEGDARQREGGGHLEIRDPHIWLSPPLVMVQARTIMRALMAADPAGRAVYETNYRRFIAEMVDLDLKIARLFSGMPKGNRFMVYHPSWGYFAEAYGLEQIPVEIEGKSPTPKALQRFIDQARDKGIRAIFVQPQFAIKSAETIARAINGQVISADPLALDWPTNLLQVAEQFKAALK
jgi:zinc transport system substrate-binding protein